MSQHLDSEVERAQRFASAEWQLYLSDTRREQELQSVATSVKATRILDLGSGGAQDLLSLAVQGVSCIALDLSEHIEVARKLFEQQDSKALGNVSFVRANAAQLPFNAASFDFINCRLVLPYTHNQTVLKEIRRVLRVDGKLLLKVHSNSFYWRKIRGAVAARKWASAAHSLWVLASGYLYQLSGWQVAWGPGRMETFQSTFRLRRELSRLGLQIEGKSINSSPTTPGFVVCAVDRTLGSATTCSSRRS